MLGLLLTGSSLFAACSTDVNMKTLGGDAGATGDAGAKGDGGEAGAPEYVFPARLNAQTVLVPSATPDTATQLLVAGTDYTSTEVVNVTLGTGALSNAKTYADGDTIPVSSGGLGFTIERGASDKVNLLDGGKISTTFDLSDVGTGTAPVDSKAYVPFYNQSLVAVLDLAEGKVSRRIDLSEFNAKGDADHSADITGAVYDPKKKIAYFLLQRIDLVALKADPAFQLHCSATKALVVGIDATTDKVIDVNGAAAGKAIELSLANPSSISINADGDTLYVGAKGCYEGTSLKQQGLEVVDLSDGTSQLDYGPADSDGISKVITIGGNLALIQTQDAAFANHWFTLDIAAMALQGGELTLPDAVSFDGKDLIGVQVTGKVGAVVRYDIATATTKVISKTSWAGKYDTAYGTALVQ